MLFTLLPGSRFKFPESSVGRRPHECRRRLSKGQPQAHMGERHCALYVYVIAAMPTFGVQGCGV